MKLEVHADAEAAARAAAAIIAVEARSAVAARGRFVVALSGGRGAGLMLRALAVEDVPWKSVHVAQVQHLLGHARLSAEQIAPMPVGSSDPDAAASRYAQTLRELAGTPPALDLVHLSLGADGHTAALVPDDPVLDVTDRDVAVTGVYQGRRRMTLTYPLLERVRSILWLVTGSDQAAALARLRNGDRSSPAARVRREHALVVADHTAAGEPGPR